MSIDETRTEKPQDTSAPQVVDIDSDVVVSLYECIRELCEIKDANPVVVALATAKINSWSIAYLSNTMDNADPLAERLAAYCAHLTLDAVHGRVQSESLRELRAAKWEEALDELREAVADSEGEEE